MPPHVPTRLCSGARFLQHSSWQSSPTCRAMLNMKYTMMWSSDGAFHAILKNVGEASIANCMSPSRALTVCWCQCTCQARTHP